MKNELKPQGNYYRKSELPKATEQALEQVIEQQLEYGAFTFAQLFAEIKYRTEYYTQMLKSERLKNLVIEEIETNEATNRDGQKALRIADMFELTKSSTGDRYDYSNDDVWCRHDEQEQQLNNKLKEIKKLKKEREDFLKVLARQKYSKMNGDAIVLDETTGAEIEPPKIISHAKPIVRVKY